MTAYATRKDVYTYGLPRGTLGANSRLLASADAGTDELELDEHGFVDDDQLVFRATEGGTLPAPLVAGTTYYAKRISDTRFKVATAAGGLAIDLTSAGSGSIVVATPLPFAEVLDFYSRLVDSVLVAHGVTLTAPYPILIVGTVAELAAKKLQHLSGVTSVSMEAVEKNAREQLKLWAAGQVVRGENAPSTATNLAVVRTRSQVTDSSGWGSGGLP